MYFSLDIGIDYLGQYTQVVVDRSYSGRNCIQNRQFYVLYANTIRRDYEGRRYRAFGKRLRGTYR
jgi:hypothetical protein